MKDNTNQMVNMRIFAESETKLLENPSKRQLQDFMKKIDNEMYTAYKGPLNQRTFYYVLYSGPQYTKNG